MIYKSVREVCVFKFFSSSVFIWELFDGNCEGLSILVIYLVNVSGVGGVVVVFSFFSEFGRVGERVG